MTAQTYSIISPPWLGSGAMGRLSEDLYGASWVGPRREEHQPSGVMALFPFWLAPRDRDRHLGDSTDRLPEIRDARVGQLLPPLPPYANIRAQVSLLITDVVASLRPDALDHTLQRLVAAEYSSDDIEVLKAQIRDEIDADFDFALQAYNVARGAVGGHTVEVEERSIAMEALAASSARIAHLLVIDVVRECLHAEDAALRFAAIATAGLLPRSERPAFKNVINELAGEGEGDSNVRRAATAFLAVS